MDEHLYEIARQIIAINLSEALRDVLDQVPLPDSLCVSNEVLYAKVSAPRHLILLGDKHAAIEYALDIFWVEYFKAGHMGRLTYQLNDNGVTVNFSHS